ncbi:MAG: Gldg family protein [Planctomycetota bacterium]
MNTNVVFAVARRDLKSWFGNPTGYVFISLFVLLSVAALLMPGEFFRNNLATLDLLNQWFPAIAVVFTAAITMGTWASERSNGTQELLFTLPARDGELLVGKYLAALGVYTVSLLFLLTLAFGLAYLGSPDWGLLFANYLGFWLLGAMLIAASMLGSQLTDNMTVSLILGALVGALVVYSGDLLDAAGAGTNWIARGPRGQFLEFGRGMITSGGVVLFVGLLVTFLYLNLALLARRHHIAGGTEGLHRGARFVAMAATVGALTVIGTNVLPRFDSTVERIHSLSQESKQLIAALDGERPVFITAFVSENVPATLAQQKRTLLNLMDQFDHLGGSKIEQRVEVCEQGSQAAQDAEKNFKIQGRRSMIDEGGVAVETTVFLGFAVQCGTEEVVVPFVEGGLPLEYELMRSIRVAADAERKTVGVLKTDVELYGGFDFQTFAQKQRWQIVEDLMLQYEVENVDPDQDYPEGLDALIVPQPSSLQQEAMDRLQNWILAGNHALLLEDPAPMEAPGTAATDQKGGPRAQMMGQQQTPKGNFAAFLGKIGLDMPVRDVVWDLSYRTFAGGNLHPEFLFVQGDGYADDPITNGLDRTVMLFSGHVKPKQGVEGWSFQPLMQSPQPTELRAPWGEPVQVLGWEIEKPTEPDPEQKRFPAELKITVPTQQGFDAEAFCRRQVGRTFSLGGDLFGNEDDVRRLSIPRRVTAYRMLDAGSGARREARLRLDVDLEEDGNGVGYLVAGSLNGVIANMNLFVFNPFGGPQQLDPRRRQVPKPADYVLAARVEGPENAEGRRPRVIAIADLDLIGNQFFQIRRAFSDANMRFDNVTFVLNCIDTLAGDTDLIELRKRRPELRKLDAVEQAQQEFEQRWIGEKERAEEAAASELEEAQARLDAAVARVRDTDLDAQAKEIKIAEAQERENRTLAIKKEQIESQKQASIEMARHERDSQKLQLYNTYRFGMVGFAILPALLLGFVSFVRRRVRESAIVPQNRMVK